MFKQNVYEMKDGIRQSIRDNGIVVIRNAFKPEFVDRLHRELLESPEWQKEHIVEHADTEQEFIYSRSQISLDSKSAPQSLEDLKSFLRGRDCQNFIAYVSGLSCLWFDGSAARLQPGDSIGVHNDNANLLRTIGFNLYLNKDWRPGFGGEFVMLNPPVIIPPTFNTLSLFRVTRSSHHKVNEVTALAKNGRLAISGWFMWTQRPKKKPIEIRLTGKTHG